MPDTLTNGSAINNSDEDPRRELLVFKARVCEQANRFDEMVEVMSDICQKYTDLSESERNLLSCAYKNVIGSRRTSWRVLDEALRANQTSACGDQISQIRSADRFNIELIKSFLKTIEVELRSHCRNIINILETRLIPSSSAVGESRVFYYKMLGDYTRYLCEICSDLERKEKANESLLAYKTASDHATIELPPTHPIRLGLMLNFSVFYYEIMKSPERSCRLAKQAFDDAIAELDTLSEESYRDSTIIMQLLRDNLNLWESEQNIQSNAVLTETNQ